MITEQDACEIIQLATDAEIEIWLDGGWGIDALIGRQTRPHDDIDLFVQRKHAPQLVGLITAQGFTEKPMAYTLEDHTVWEDGNGRTIDLHVFDFIENDQIAFLGEHYPAEVFSGRGAIAGIKVSCIEPASQLLFHLGYEHDDNDVHDVMLLCEAFGFDVPEEYRQQENI